MIWNLIMGGIIGWLAGVIMKRDIPGGIIGNIIAGLLGSWIGGKLFTSSAQPAGFIASLVGAILLIAVVSFFMGNSRS